MGDINEAVTLAAQWASRIGRKKTQKTQISSHFEPFVNFCGSSFVFYPAT
jgi:hypothetical protein